MSKEACDIDKIRHYKNVIIKTHTSAQAQC